MPDIDKGTLKDIKNGNIKEFEKLFKSLYPLLCRYAERILNNKENAEQVVQDVFYLLWKNRETIDIRSSLKSYLYKAVFNKAMHLVEHEMVEKKYQSYLAFHESQSISTDQSVIDGEVYQLYRQTLKELPDRCREVFLLSRNQGLKYIEIAEKLAISVKTVEANMGKALSMFRRNFAEYLQ
jgi:RNA polymerase sigma-70 factor, ECF subfamily